MADVPEALTLCAVLGRFFVVLVCYVCMYAAAVFVGKQGKRITTRGGVARRRSR